MKQTVLRRGLALLGLLFFAAIATAADGVDASGVSKGITDHAGLHGRVLWVDAGANMHRLSTREAVDALFEKCQQAHINTVVIDVKPLSGYSLYHSEIVPRIGEWRGQQYPHNFDVLTMAIVHGRRRGIKVHAAINVFSEAHKLVGIGPLYDDPRHQSTIYDVERRIFSEEGANRLLEMGVNSPGGPNGLVAYDSGHRARIELRGEDVAAVIIRDTVLLVTTGWEAAAGLTVPQDGHVLVGRGESATWMLNYLRPGLLIGYHARDVIQPILEAPSERVGMFVNPALPDVRRRALRVVHELADKYALDGIVFDRMRYASLRADFSNFSRRQFEEWLGRPVARWPQDILTWPANPSYSFTQGPLFREWIEWRAQVIHDWLEEAREMVQRTRPGMSVGAYVGSWYDSYYDVGVNWGSPEYHAGYAWMTPKYNRTGYADLLDWISTGCYYPIATRATARVRQEPEERTVEAAADLSMRAVDDASFVYAGLYVLDYKGLPEAFRQALEVADSRSQGVMLFDLVYIDEYDWWHILRDTFARPRTAPHDVRGLRAGIAETTRALRAAQ